MKLHSHPNFSFKLIANAFEGVVAKRRDADNLVNLNTQQVVLPIPSSPDTLTSSGELSAEPSSDHSLSDGLLAEELNFERSHQPLTRNHISEVGGTTISIMGNIKIIK
jgi:hypothetical protein